MSATSGAYLKQNRNGQMDMQMDRHRDVKYPKTSENIRNHLKSPENARTLRKCPTLCEHVRTQPKTLKNCAQTSKRVNISETAWKSLKTTKQQKDCTGQPSPLGKSKSAYNKENLIRYMQRPLKTLITVRFCPMLECPARAALKGVLCFPTTKWPCQQTIYD